jgi:hypothetical protein
MRGSASMLKTVLQRVRVPKAAKRIVKWGPLYDVLRPGLERITIGRWVTKGRPVPASHLVKQAIVRNYQRAFNLAVLVETGTFLGDMVASTKKDFKKVFTIELDDTLCRRAKKRFAMFPHVSVIQGDSGEQLPMVLKKVEERALFWLDGHYSGGITARGREDSPILRELNHIFSHPIKDHVILIDDARCFTGEGGYPTIEQLHDLVNRNRPHWSIEVEDDIIRMH